MQKKKKKLKKMMEKRNKNIKWIGEKKQQMRSQK